MKSLVRLALCSLFVASCSTVAFADSLQVNGTANFDTENVYLSPPFTNAGDIGIFSEFSNSQINFVLMAAPYIYGVPGGNELVFVLTSGTDTVAFYDQVNTPITSIDPQGNLDVLLHETGYYLFNGTTSRAGYYDVQLNGTSANGTNGTAVAFTGSGALDVPLATAVTPEPASIFLIGTGLLGMAGLLRKRSRPTA